MCDAMLYTYRPSIFSYSFLKMMVRVGIGVDGRGK
jgi:hypothetical protein